MSNSFDDLLYELMKDNETAGFAGSVVGIRDFLETLYRFALDGRSEDEAKSFCLLQNKYLTQNIEYLEECAEYAYGASEFQYALILNEDMLNNTVEYLHFLKGFKEGKDALEDLKENVQLQMLATNVAFSESVLDKLSNFIDKVNNHLNNLNFVFNGLNQDPKTLFKRYDEVITKFQESVKADSEEREF